MIVNLDLWPWPSNVGWRWTSVSNIWVQGRARYSHTPGLVAADRPRALQTTTDDADRRQRVKQYWPIRPSIVLRPGIELTTIESQFRRPNHSTTEAAACVCVWIESRDYCQLETFYAACSGAGLGSDKPLKVVSVLSARYGRMRQDGRCVMRDYGHVGCAADVLAHVDRLCSGELHFNPFCLNEWMKMRGF